jgi:hypothetical protein
MRRDLLLALPRFLLAATLAAGCCAGLLSYQGGDIGPMDFGPAICVIGLVVAIAIAVAGSVGQAYLRKKHALYTLAADIVISLLIIAGAFGFMMIL